jgi:hypothetical protein
MDALLGGNVIHNLPSVNEGREESAGEGTASSPGPEGGLHRLISAGVSGRRGSPQPILPPATLDRGSIMTEGKKNSQQKKWNVYLGEIDNYRRIRLREQPAENDRARE